LRESGELGVWSGEQVEDRASEIRSQKSEVSKTAEPLNREPLNHRAWSMERGAGSRLKTEVKGRRSVGQ